MQEYRNLIEALVGMAEITRPAPGTPETQDTKIVHGICDMMEDAAVAIDDLLNKLEGKNADEGTGRKSAELAY